MNHVRRLSPSSRLVLASVVLAIVLAGIAGSVRETSTFAEAAASDAVADVATPGIAAAPASPDFRRSTSTPTQRPPISSIPSLPAETPTMPGIHPVTPPPAFTPSPTSTSTVAPTAVTTTPVPPPTLGDGTYPMAAVLGVLQVAPEQRSGYERSLFRHWVDADGDGCDTRREVLIDEAVIPPSVSAGCSLSGGEWFSAYDGLTFTDPGDLDIDHVVALAEAWDSGAYAWDAARRRAFANDLGVPWSLIAVSASSNRSKSDKDPADWLPTNASVRCRYLGDWVAVKARWGLAVDDAERSVLAAAADCRELLIDVVITE